MYPEMYFPELEESTGKSPLAHLCPIPDPLETDREWDTYYHRDLLAMSLPEVEVARSRLLMRMAAERDHHPWLLERLQQLEGRIAREG